MLVHRTYADQLSRFINGIYKTLTSLLKGIWSLVIRRGNCSLSGKSMYIIQRLNCIFSDSLLHIFTTRIRSMGKVMFSQTCVIIFTGWGLPLPSMHHWSHNWGSTSWQGFCLQGGLPPLRYSQPAGGTHPAGMHTC